ncbi:MAG: HAMP domain-containing histidine kinase [Kofleriaceae bacterium]|nr:HAMP domain-containing histidine kinase [Myxococcales bacterium]MCB9574653.1 HAMP domain-containing histidine kinase [Kofleriaceae bacterium]
MRLTRKLILALTFATLLILGVGAFLQVQREVMLFDQLGRRNDAFVGRLLARAVGDAWKAGGEPAAAAIVRDADLTGTHLHVRWVWLDSRTERARLDDELLAQAMRGEIVAQRIGTENGGALITVVPVAVPDGRLGALELSEPLNEQERYIHATIRNAALSTAILIATLSAASLMIGMTFIGRPTRALVAKARRVAAGDLSGPLVLPQRDELGHLASELNAMCDQLATARDRAAAESEARVAAVEQLRHADRLTTVGRLAAGVAHELGTPLNVVGGRAQLIASGELEGDEIGASARIIQDQARRMTAIIRQLLDFARPRAAQAERVALHDVASRIIALVDSTARKKDVALALVDDGHGVEAWADDGPLQQALLNIVVNAIHATPAGGRVELTVDEVDATAPGGRPAGTRWARVRVRDTGTGMDEATLARIYEPFFTTKGVGEGTGLGLSVTYGIVRDAGGWVDVTSAPGEGSTFAVHLPRPDDAGAPEHTT